MNANIDAVNDDLEKGVKRRQRIDMLVNLRFGDRIIIGSPERKHKIRNFTNERIS